MSPEAPQTSETPKAPETSKSMEKGKSSHEAAIQLTLETRSNRVRQHMEQAEKEGKDGSIDAVFLDVQSDMLTKGKELLGAIVDEQLTKEPFSRVPLTEKQKTNLKIGITARLSSGGIMASLFNGMSTKIWQVQKMLSEKKWTDVASLFKGTEEAVWKKGESKEKKSGLEQMIEQAKHLVEGVISPLEQLITANQIDTYKQLLDNPQCIAEYKADGKIPPATMDQIAFLANVNLNLLRLDGTLRTIDQTVDKWLNLLAGAPEFVESGMMGMLKMLLKIPFLDKILAFMLGYTDPNEVIAGTEEKISRKRAVLSLKSFGIVRDEKWVEKKGENASKIKWLETIDMTSISDKKLEPFFEFCKKNEVGIKKDEKTIDRHTQDFWRGVFTGEPKIEMNMKKGETVERTAFPTLDIEKYTPKITDADSLMTALNKLSETPTEQAAQTKEDKKPEGTEAAAPVAAATAAAATAAETKKWEKKEATKEEIAQKRIQAISAAFKWANGTQTTINVDYKGFWLDSWAPKTIEFKKQGEKWNEIVLDGVKYALTVKAGEKDKYLPYLKEYSFTPGGVRFDFSLERWATFAVQHPGEASKWWTPFVSTYDTLAENITTLVDNGSVKIEWNNGYVEMKKA